MAVLPGVLGCRRLRRTVQVRLGTNILRLPGGTPIFAISRQQFMKYRWATERNFSRGQGKCLLFGKIQVDLFTIEDLVLRRRPEYNSFGGKEVLGLNRKAKDAGKKKRLEIYCCPVP